MERMVLDPHGAIPHHLQNPAMTAHRETNGYSCMAQISPIPALLSLNAFYSLK